MQPFEKLGAFYLGAEYDLAAGQRLDRSVLYDARDLTTHAVCVGMTGSGKTGLCIDLLEEAAIDNVPAIIVDPKGDITNLLLTFPELRPQDFEPWVNVDDARRKGQSVAEYAQYVADLWRNGLADWGEGPERIRMLKDSADFRIYTPGSDSGLPVSILASLRAPSLSWDEEAELLREQIQGTVGALLGLVGVEADPLRSREHILLAHIFEHYWRQGEDLDLERLITAIQTPPVRKLGVFEVDTFFPEKDRFSLAMALNGIIAAPSFASWIQGEPLDIAHLFHTPSGKPRHSIFYIAHLSDDERMFFVTLLLEQIVTWVRRQSGTTSLRALLYFDEAFGFFPPVANPPSKRPLLTLLKQARAFGLGVVLTTQNPVDLDYKGLTNAGTWFIGKLQTEQDKARVLDGLESAAAEAGGSLQRRDIDRAISALGSRVFLLHNVHQEQPVIFHTRWAMSYLRGPLTRTQVRDLMAGAKVEAVADAVSPAPARPAVRPDLSPVGAPVPEALRGYSSVLPALPPDLEQVFLPIRSSPRQALARLEEEVGRRVEVQETTLLYEPCLLALGRVSFVDQKRGVDETRDVGVLVQAGDLGIVVRWADADPVKLQPRELEREPAKEARFGPVAEELNAASKVRSLSKDFGEYLYREQGLEIFYNPVLELYGRPGESERDFGARAQQLARERRDAEVEALRKKTERELDSLEERLAREERDLAREEAQYDARKREELISAGETLVGMLGVFGSRRSSRGLSQAATKRRLTVEAKADIAEAEAAVERLGEQIEELRRNLEEEADAITRKWADTLSDIETYSVRPRRADVEVQLVSLAWAPYWEVGYASAQGDVTYDGVPAWG